MSLELFTFQVCDPGMMDEDESYDDTAFTAIFSSLFDNVPNSLTQLGVRFCSENELLCERKLADPTWLPHLEVIQIDDEDLPLGERGWLTVMTETGRLRPVSKLQAVMTHVMDLTCFDQLIHLDVTCPNVSFLHAFGAMSDSCLASLQHLDIIASIQGMEDSSSFDVSSTFYFASKRPLTSLTIHFSPPPGEQLRIHMSTEAFELLGLLNKLLTLELDARSMVPELLNWDQYWFACSIDICQILSTSRASNVTNLTEILGNTASIQFDSQ